MIIKPKRRGGFDAFSDYLNGEADNRDENEECNFIVTGNSLGIDNVNSWCIYANQQAEPKRHGKRPLKNPIEHIIMRTRKGDLLKPEMAAPKVPELLEALGYQNCPWVLVQHLKDGEPHYHLGVCRIDNGKIPNPKSGDVCLQMANKFAKEFGFKPAYDGKEAKPYARKAAKLEGLWNDAEAMKPEERLQHFIKNGFVPTRGNRNQLLFVDKDGKPHSPQRIPAAREKGLRQKDMPTYFGLTAGMVRALPDCKAVSASLRKGGWKPIRNRITRRISNGRIQTRYTRYHGSNIGHHFSVPYLSPRHGVRLQTHHQPLPSRTHGTGFPRNAEVQSIRGIPATFIDPTVYGRAQAAAKDVAVRFAAAIDAAEKDQSLTDDQRAATIAALRLRQQLEEEAVRRKIIEEEHQNVKARRRYYAALNAKPILT